MVTSRPAATRPNTFLNGSARLGFALDGDEFGVHREFNHIVFRRVASLCVYVCRRDVCYSIPDPGRLSFELQRDATDQQLSKKEFQLSIRVADRLLARPLTSQLHSPSDKLLDSHKPRAVRANRVLDCGFVYVEHFSGAISGTM